MILLGWILVDQVRAALTDQTKWPSSLAFGFPKQLAWEDASQDVLFLQSSHENE